MTIHLRRTVLLAVTLLTSLAKLAHAGSVDDYLKAQMAARHIPGLSVAVVQDGKVVKTAAYGLSDVSAKTPATPGTVYQIASLTKQFTAAAVLTLVQQGKISADDSITHTLSGLPSAWKAITVRELLNQTSGLRDYRLGSGQVLRLATTKPLKFVPGTQFEYCNTNYRLLGMIIEKVSGKSYSDYLQQTFFRPLGMTHSSVIRPHPAVPNLARGTVWTGTALQPSPFGPTVDFGATGVLTTVTDLVKWNAALDGDTLLNPDSKRLLWTPPTLASGAPTSYASGWFNMKVKDHSLLWHNGAIYDGYTGGIFKFPSDKLTLIVLTNSLDIPGLKTELPMFGLTLGLAKLSLPDLAKEEPAIPDTDPKTAALLRKVSAQIAAGKLDGSLFAPALRAALTPAAVNPAHDLLAPLGPITSLVLLRRTSDGLAVYRALYGTVAVDWLISVDTDRKINVLRPQAE